MTTIEGGTPDSREVWFLTGSQHLYGEETLRQVADQSQTIAKEMDASGVLPARGVWKPILAGGAATHTATLGANATPESIGVTPWRHPFSPAKMWCTGLDALGKPMLHLHTQAGAELPWSSIDMDFMNLNQAAHGDREFAFVGAR